MRFVFWGVVGILIGCGSKGNDDEVRTFAKAVCEAVVQGDEAGYLRHLIAESDTSQNGEMSWFPYAGAEQDSWSAWQAGAKTNFDQIKADIHGNARCGDVIAINRPTSPSDVEKRQGRVNSVTMEIAGADGRQALVIGSTVLADQGRRFHGEQSGSFLSWQ
jgi:hypothetical protein